MKYSIVYNKKRKCPPPPYNRRNTNVRYMYIFCLVKI